MVHIKYHFPLLGNSNPGSDGSGFPLSLSGSLPYVRRHVTLKNAFQPLIHDWFNKGRGMCYHVYGMVLIGKNSPVSGGSGVPLLLSEWSFTICPTPYNRKKNLVLSVLLKKIIPSSVKNASSASLIRTLPSCLCSRTDHHRLVQFQFHFINVSRPSSTAKNVEMLFN